MRILQRRFALIIRYVLGVLILVPLVFAQGTQPQAAVVQFDGTGVTGITGLPVVGVGTVDISFAVGSYTSVFGTELFPNAQPIIIAINSVLNPVNPLDPVPTISTSVSARLNVYGIPDSVFFDGLSVSTTIGFCDPLLIFAGTCTEPWALGLTPIKTDIDACCFDWAVPTLTPVPLPAALPLFGSALAMLGIVGWRRRRQAGA